jgi:hypothetical protein
MNSRIIARRSELYEECASAGEKGRKGGQSWHVLGAERARKGGPPHLADVLSLEMVPDGKGSERPISSGCSSASPAVLITPGPSRASPGEKILIL